MTNEEIIFKFPPHKLICRGDIRPVLDVILKSAKTYHEICPAILKKCKELFPKPNGLLRFDGLTDEDWERYFWSQYDEKLKKIVKPPIIEWISLVEDEFVARHGKYHTFDEACRIAADKWCEMCFGNHIQDNGDRSTTGLFGNMLATIVADKYREGIGEVTIGKVRENLYEYYKGGCMYTFDDGMQAFSVPSCDYSSNSPLFYALKNAGLDEKTIDCICPIKTSIHIDEKDNAVVVRGYQKEEYI